MNARILVVEDDGHIAEGLRFNLEAEGYQGQGPNPFASCGMQLSVPLRKTLYLECQDLRAAQHYYLYSLILICVFLLAV